MRATCYRGDGNNRGRQRTALTLAVRSLRCEIHRRRSVFTAKLGVVPTGNLCGAILGNDPFWTPEAVPEGNASAVADSVTGAFDVLASKPGNVGKSDVPKRLIEAVRFVYSGPNVSTRSPALKKEYITVLRTAQSPTVPRQYHHAGAAPSESIHAAGISESAATHAVIVSAKPAVTAPR
jgi:hypothetical protein